MQFRFSLECAEIPSALVCRWCCGPLEKISGSPAWPTLTAGIIPQAGRAGGSTEHGQMWSSGPHACGGTAEKCREHTKFSPSRRARWLNPELIQVATAAKKCRWTAELALSPAWGLFLHRCNHCPYLPLPMQYRVEQCIILPIILLLENHAGIFSWLNSDSRVFWPLKLSLVLTWNNFPFINLWILWFCSCIWKILNAVTCLAFYYLFFV